MEYLEFALVGDIRSAPHTTHFVGLPPTLTGDDDIRHPLPLARVLVLMRDANGSGIFLYRFAADGSFAGDTWHEDVLAAKDQADYEYNGAVGPWSPLHQNISDLAAFVSSLTIQRDAAT